MSSCILSTNTNNKKVKRCVGRGERGEGRGERGEGRGERGGIVEEMVKRFPNIFVFSVTLQ